MDPTIWGAAVGGLITAVPAVWAVIASNRQYPEEGSEIRFVPPPEPPERQG